MVVLLDRGAGQPSVPVSRLLNPSSQSRPTVTIHTDAAAKLG